MKDGDFIIIMVSQAKVINNKYEDSTGPLTTLVTTSVTRPTSLATLTSLGTVVSLTTSAR